MDQPENTGQNQAIRNEKGQFVPGVSGNPAGKPPGTKHMSTLLEEAIKKVAEGSDDPEDLQIVKALIKKAKSGDISAIKEIWDRLEGKAAQSLDVKSDGTLTINVVNYSGDHDTPSV